MTPEISLDVPLLFWRSGDLGIVQFLTIYLDPGKHDLLDPRIREPLRDLDFSLPPRGRRLLKALLPRRTDRADYGCGYYRPPREIDLFTGKFPEGFSHFLPVLLGFYALGADELLGGDAFRRALAGWTATGYPDKGGRIRRVEHVVDKLGIVGRDNPSIVREFHRCALTRVLIPEENRTDLPKAAGGRGDALSVPFECANGSQIEVWPVESFPQALARVFGTELIGSYRRRYLKRRLLRLAPVVLLSVVLVAGLAFLVPHPRRLIGVEMNPAAPETLRVLTEGGESNAGPFGAEVGTTALMPGPTGTPEAVIVGLRVEGERRGDVLRLDQDWLGNWREVWRTRPWEGCYGLDSSPIKLCARQLLVADVLPQEPGTEIVGIFSCALQTSALVVLSEEGRVLGRLWHFGTIERIALLRDPTRIAAIACQNGLATVDEPSRSPVDKWDRVLFTVRPESIRGRSPGRNGKWLNDPLFAQELCQFEYYLRIVPKGYFPERILAYPEGVPQPAELMVSVPGWVMYIDGHGNVVGRVKDMRAEGPSPDLEEVDMK